MTGISLPPELAARGERTLQQLDLESLPASLQADALRVFALSDFASSAAARQCDWLAAALSSHGFEHGPTPAVLASAIAAQLEGVTDMTALKRGLRVLRQRFQLWLVWRHCCGAPLEDTMAGASALADALIDAALDHLEGWLGERRGIPIGDESGEPLRLVVLALGKLGGGELNLSSDVDLIFAYPERGQTRRADGSVGEGNQQFFVRLGQQLIQTLDEVTADGFCFRVDMRLRPFGGSGPLAMDSDSVQDYYATQGRDWERYALMKARACAGDVASGERLLEALRPFVFRRYLDFGAIDALRDMKRKLLKERHSEEDVKLGPGGIRDVEFAVQMQQMIWGGRERALQAPALLEVLPALVRLGRVDASTAQTLEGAYRFLRDTEHSLQAEADQQTQQLPGSEDSRLRLAVSRGFDSFEVFSAALAGHRSGVAAIFDDLLGDGSPSSEEEPESPAALAWEGQDVGHQLAALGFREPESAARTLEMLRTARDRSAVSAEARLRLDRLLPVTLDALGKGPQPDLALARIGPVLRAVLRRSAYLALLAENPRALARFVELAASSLWLAESLVEHPAFLDALLDDAGLAAVPDRAALLAALKAQLAEAADAEARLDVLREFKAHHVFDVALAELRGTLPLMKVSDALTFLAEAILEGALDLAWQETAERFPEYSEQAAFVIVGYGKLGGIELGPGSDLDIVFLHDLPGTPGPFLQRLTRRLLHALTARTYQGGLYEIDTRLRPSGSAGTMVTSLAAFADYQRGQAWTWEQQALVRARAVAGDPELATRFETLRREVLCQPRDLAELKEAVVAMRQRLSEHHDDDADLKQGAGGIVDIEFVVQYLVLAHAHEHPSLAVFSDNVRILDDVERLGLLPDGVAAQLREAYLALRSEWHRTVLDIPDPERAAGVLAEHRSAVRSAWADLFGRPA